MKTTFLALAAGAALLLGACGTTPILSTPSAQLTAAKSDYIFELAVTTTQNAYLAANAQGSIPASVKARVKPLLHDAVIAANAAHGAAALGDADTLAKQAATAYSLASQAWSLFKPGVAFPVQGAPTAPAH